MRKKMVNGLLCVVVGLLMLVLMGASGCSSTTSNIGDGKVDAVEAATIQIAVGLAMAAAPETIAPAYAVSTALLAVMDGEEPVALDRLGDVVDDQVAALELTEAERQSVGDLVSLIRAKIRERLNLSEITENKKLVVVRDVLRIVKRSAAARLAG